MNWVSSRKFILCYFEAVLMLQLKHSEILKRYIEYYYCALTHKGHRGKSQISHREFFQKVRSSTHSGINIQLSTTVSVVNWIVYIIRPLWFVWTFYIQI